MFSWINKLRKEIFPTKQEVRAAKISELRELLPKLQSLSREIARIINDEQTDALLRLVQLLSLTSTWCDNEITNIWLEQIGCSMYSDHKLAEIEQMLKELIKLIEKGRRDLLGMNRTMEGEAVTPDNVWVGDIGLWSADTVTHLRSLPKQDERRQLMNVYAQTFIGLFWPIIRIVERLEVLLAPEPEQQQKLKPKQ